MYFVFCEITNKYVRYINICTGPGMETWESPPHAIDFGRSDQSQRMDQLNTLHEYVLMATRSRMGLVQRKVAHAY